eukprot:GHVP01063536.1.p1 GENE.GHVP01063536.1~~GHVP01063536.1.p1  ORF type:complete len:104 (+),score=11.25 GHVP01063536.1:106-417(+)
MHFFPMNEVAEFLIPTASNLVDHEAFIQGHNRDPSLAKQAIKRCERNTCSYSIICKKDKQSPQNSKSNTENDDTNTQNSQSNTENDDTNTQFIFGISNLKSIL